MSAKHESAKFLDQLDELIGASGPSDIHTPVTEYDPLLRREELAIRTRLQPVEAGLLDIARIVEIGPVPEIIRSPSREHAGRLIAARCLAAAGLAGERGFTPPPEEIGTHTFLQEYRPTYPVGYDAARSVIYFYKRTKSLHTADGGLEDKALSRVQEMTSFVTRNGAQYSAEWHTLIAARYPLAKFDIRCGDEQFAGAVLATIRAKSATYVSWLKHSSPADHATARSVASRESS